MSETAKSAPVPSAVTAPPLSKGPTIEPRPNSRTNPAAAATRFAGATESLMSAAEIAYIGKIKPPVSSDAA